MNCKTGNDGLARKTTQDNYMDVSGFPSLCPHLYTMFGKEPQETKLTFFQQMRIVAHLLNNLRKMHR